GAGRGQRLLDVRRETRLGVPPGARRRDAGAEGEGHRYARVLLSDALAAGLPRRAGSPLSRHLRPLPRLGRPLEPRSLSSLRPLSDPRAGRGSRRAASRVPALISRANLRLTPASTEPGGPMSLRGAFIGIAFLLRALALGAAAPAPAADVSGEWLLTTVWFGEPVAERLTLKVEKGKLAGSVRHGGDTPVTGRIDGDRVRFEWKEKDGQIFVYEG